MRVTVLGSGSSGNSILVEAGGTRLLVDAGFSGRDLERRLDEVDIPPASIDALLVTHDHSDHTRGMGVLARRWGIPICLTTRTHIACRRLLQGGEAIRLYSSDESLVIGELRVDPFLTVHDAVDPVAVTVTETATGEKLGIATDLGRPTETVRSALRGCDFLVLESNYDEVLLRESPYPWSVKARIASSRGHLSNRDAARLVAELAHPGLAGVVLAHLSEKANDPTAAEATVGLALEELRYRGSLAIGRQSSPLEPIDVGRLRRRLLPAQIGIF